MGLLARLNKHKILFLILLLYIVWSVVFIFQTSVVAVDNNRYFNLFDDAMISMRYAWNFSHGFSLVWNPGEMVEGYTNLLMTLLMSVYAGLFNKSIAVLAVQITGLIIILVCVYFSWKLSDYFLEDMEEKKRDSAKIIILVMILTYYPFSFWSLLGMETGLLTLFVLSSLYLTELYFRGVGRYNLLIMAGLQGLAYLTRPDAVIFFMPIILYVFFRRWKLSSDLSVSRELLPAIFLYALFVVGQEFFRFNYYHEYLPNTYYLKLTGMPLFDRIKNGLGFIMPYMLTHILLLGISLGSLIIRPRARKIFYFAIVLLPILYQVWVGGDPWPYWRMMTPSYPLLAILFIEGGCELSSEKRLPLALTGMGTRLIFYLVALGILTSNVSFFGEMLFIMKPFETDQYETFVNTALVLDEVTYEGATVGVYYAGVIPYYTDRKAIDFLGKNDKYIARLPPDLSGAVAWSGMYSVPGHNKYDLNYSIKQLQPTYIQYPIWKGQNLLSWATENYLVVDYKGITLWLRKNDPNVKWQALLP